MALTMATQQRQVSPVPPGRYWTDLSGEHVSDFDQWVRDMAGAVVVETAERETRPVDATGLRSGTVPFLFVVWSVPEGRAPFYPRHLGFPNFAPVGEVHRKADIVDLGPESTITDELPRIESVSNFGAGLGLAGLAVLVLVALRR